MSLQGLGEVNRGVEFLFQAEQEVNSAFLFLLPSFRLFPFLTLGSVGKSNPTGTLLTSLKSYSIR